MALTVRDVALIATFQLSLLAFVPAMMFSKEYPEYSYIVIVPVVGMLIGPVLSVASWIRTAFRRRQGELQLTADVEKFLAERGA